MDLTFCSERLVLICKMRWPLNMKKRLARFCKRLKLISHNLWVSNCHLTVLLIQLLETKNPLLIAVIALAIVRSAPTGTRAGGDVSYS